MEVLRLEGPGSLSADVNESINSDFVVIDGDSEGADDPYDTSVFDSLSQADAVSQLKNLFIEKNDLHKKFIECSGRLAATAELLESQKKEEKSKCDKAKRRIDDLMGERTLQKKEIDDLTEKLQSSLNLTGGENGFTRAAMVTSDSDLINPEHTTACPSCHPSLANALTQSEIQNTSTVHIEELKKELKLMKDANESNTRKWRKEREELESKISKADLKVIDISGSYENLRQQNLVFETQLSNKKSEADRLSKRLQESEHRQQNGFSEINMRHAQEKSALTSKIQTLEDRLRAAEQEKQTISSEKESLESANAYLQSEKVKEGTKLEGDYQNMVQVNMELRKQNDSLLAVKQALLGKIGDCTSKMREFLPVKQENHTLKGRVTELQEALDSWKQNANDLSQKKVKAEQQLQEVQRLRLTTEQQLQVGKQDKVKIEGELKMIRQQLTTATQQLQTITAQKQTSDLDAQAKGHKIEDLQSQISKLEQSVGDEVPGLIQESMELKDKLRDEKKKTDAQMQEAAQLRDVKNRQDLDLARKTQQVNNLNGIVTQLKQEMATKDGEMGRLRTQIGELNSQNIRQTVATHAAPPYIPPQPAIPEGAAGQEQPTNGPQSNMIQCPMCEVVGDAEFINNHCNRDHFN